MNPDRAPAVAGKATDLAWAQEAVSRWLELLGRRWALRLLVELHAGALGFRELQARCDRMSASVLARRLGELVVAGVLATDVTGRYELTEAGRELTGILQPLKRWVMRHDLPGLPRTEKRT